MNLLEKDGFEIIPDFFDADRISSLTGAIEGSGHPRSRAGMRGAIEIPAVQAVVADPGLLALASSTLGGRAIPFRATFFDKSADSNWLVVWHQDTAIPIRERCDAEGWGPWSVKEGVLCVHAPASALEQVLAIRIHLDDSTSENGPLKVLRSAHTFGVLSDERIEELADDTQPYECHIAMGGLLLMKPLIVHASSKVRKGKRRVLHIEYSSQRHFAGGPELQVQ